MTDESLERERDADESRIELERERAQWKLRAENSENFLAELRDVIARMFALRPLTASGSDDVLKHARAAVQAQDVYIKKLEELLSDARKNAPSPEWQERCRVAELTLAETREALAKVTRERDEAVKQRDELRRRL